MTVDQEDKQAVRRVRNGDVDSFECLLTKYSPLVEGLLCRHLSRDDVPEVAQEAFLQAFTSLDSYDESRPFGRWVGTIALRSCYQHLRKHYNNKESLVSDLGYDLSSLVDLIDGLGAVAEHEQRESERETAQLLHLALERIAPKDRMILTLTHLDGHTSSEAAKILGLTQVNVRVRACRSRRKLRRVLESLMGEGK